LPPFRHAAGVVAGNLAGQKPEYGLQQGESQEDFLPRLLGTEGKPHAG